MSAFPMFPLSERPKLFEDQNLGIEEDQAYIITGMGVVASKGVYEKLNGGHCILEWE